MVLNTVLTVELNSTQLVKNLKKISSVAELEGNDDHAAFNDEATRVYFIQRRMHGGSRFKFFFVTSDLKSCDTIFTPSHEEAEKLINQPEIDFRPGALSAPADWWQSTDTKKLFKPLVSLSENNAAHMAVLNMIELFDNALKKGADVLSLVDGYEDENTTFDRFEKEEINTFRTDITQRCQYLRAALIVASNVDGNESTLNWGDCIVESVK